MLPNAMANEEHVRILKQGVEAWNDWRKKNPGKKPDLTLADLKKIRLRRVDFDQIDLTWAQLGGAELEGVSLLRADLSNAQLSGSNMRFANLSWVTGRWVEFSGAYLEEARGINADFRHGDFQKAYLVGANFSKARLAGADFRGANLIAARLDLANLSGTKLWGTQREGWSIKGVICESAYWDEEGLELTEYVQGEFERAYAEKPKIVLKYPDGIHPVQLAMLPLLLEKLEREHEGCRLHIRSVRDSGIGATVTITVDDTEGRDPETLQNEIRLLQGKLEGYQLALQHKGHEVLSLAGQLAALRDKTYSLLLESYERRSQESRQGREALAVLFLDLTGYSKMDEEGQLGAVDSVRRTGRMVLEKHGARYSNTWGDAIVAGFDKPGDGIVCACKLIEHLKVEGLSARIGMSHGLLSVSFDQVKGGLNMDGPPMSEGARLEPLAKPGEVLISKSLRFHPEVAGDGRFEFAEEKRPLKKAVGELPEGHEIECWSVRLKG